MEKPELSPQPMYDMMMKTWNSDPKKRPNFLELMDELGDLLEEGTKDDYLTLTENFDASTIGTVNAVENKDYLGIMSAPDFMSQMSVTPTQVSPEDGYLIPSKKPDQSLKLDLDEYLMPNGKTIEIERASLTGNGNGNATTAV